MNLSLHRRVFSTKSYANDGIDWERDRERGRVVVVVHIPEPGGTFAMCLSRRDVRRRRGTTVLSSLTISSVEAASPELNDNGGFNHLLGGGDESTTPS